MKQAALLISMLILATQSGLAQEPEIIGSAQYSNRVHQALLLLESHDANAYAIVTNNIGRITEGEHSGMWAYQNPPTYEMSDVTAFHSLTWCAATIAHDSYHSKLYHDYKSAHAGESVPDEIWIGRTAEQQCMQHQIEVMKRIGATQRELDWATQQADGHYVSDTNSWRNFDRRKW